MLSLVLGVLLAAAILAIVILLAKVGRLGRQVAGFHQRARLPDPVSHLRDQLELALLGLLADEVPADGHR
jgi:hypothetical protein